jgi:hypothetical protein
MTLEQKHRALASQGTVLMNLQSVQPTQTWNLTMKYRDHLCADSILEPNINEVLSDFLTLGGRPMDVVSCLSESYVGLPTLCNTAGEWGNELGLNSQDLMRDVIKGMLLDRFDSAAVDTKFMGAEVTFHSCQSMRSHPHKLGTNAFHGCQ